MMLDGGNGPESAAEEVANHPSKIVGVVVGKNAAP
jgi:hypothetical protein